VATELQLEATRTKTDNRRSLMEVLEFLVQRGANTDTLRLAMVRAGITEEVARVLAQCIVSPESIAPPAEAQAVAEPARVEPPPRAVEPQPAPIHKTSHHSSGRAAEKALRSMLGAIFMIAAIWGVGIVLGFAVGLELGVAQGLERGIDEGIERVLRFAGL
jgi:hypothetical protein